VGAASAVTTGRAVKLTVRTRSAHRSDIEQAVTERVTQALTAGNVSIISFAVARRALSPTTVSRACLVLVGVAGVIMTSEQDGDRRVRSRPAGRPPAGGSSPRGSRRARTQTPATTSAAEAPHAAQRRSGDDRDLSAPGNLQRNVNSPVRVTPTEERRAVNRVDNPNPIGLTELTKFLAEERIFWPRRRQRLAKQSLDCPVGFRDWCAVGLQRCQNARLEVSEREVRRQVRRVERELQVINAVHVPLTLSAASGGLPRQRSGLPAARPAAAR